MAGRIKVVLNRPGLAAKLKDDDVREAVRDVAEEIKRHVDAEGVIVGGFDEDPGDIPLPVEIYSDTTTDRAVETVVLAHPAGVAVQAKHGVLTRAASAAGLKVESKR